MAMSAQAYSTPSMATSYKIRQKISISDNDIEMIPRLLHKRKSTSFKKSKNYYKNLNEDISTLVQEQLQKIINDSKKLIDIDEWKSVISRLNQLEKQTQEMQKEINLLHTKLENSIILPSNTQNVNGMIVSLHTSIVQESDNMLIMPSNEQIMNANNVEDNNNSSIKEPAWIVEKERCQILIEKAQKQIPLFLPLLLPEIYNAAEIISPTSFPEADIKMTEVQSVIQYFWQNQSTPDFYAKLIEKEFQTQRYKVTRKLYHSLKFSNTCIMRKDGKLYDYKCDRVTPNIMSYNDENFEWFIPEELTFDDYVVGARKNSNNETHIYQLDLYTSQMTLLHTKRK